MQVHADGLEVARQARDRGHPAHAHGRDRVPPGAAVEASAAGSADAPGHADQGRGDLPTSLLARRRVSRARRWPTSGPRAPPSTRAPATASPGVMLGFVGGPRRPRVGGAVKAAAAAAVLKNFADYYGAEGAQAEEVLRAGLEQGGLDARLPGGLHRPRRAVRVRACAAHVAVGRDPLGRHRDVDVLDGVHGRRGALGRARRARSSARRSTLVRQRAC